MKSWHYLIIFKKSNNYISRWWKEYLLYKPLQSCRNALVVLISQWVIFDWNWFLNYLCDRWSLCVDNFGSAPSSWLCAGVPCAVDQTSLIFLQRCGTSLPSVVAHIAHSTRITYFKGILLIKHISPSMLNSHTADDALHKLTLNTFLLSCPTYCKHSFSVRSPCRGLIKLLYKCHITGLFHLRRFPRGPRIIQEFYLPFDRRN